MNSLKGLLQEAVLATLPWFRRTRSASLARLRRLNATLAQADRFEEVVHFSDDVRQAGELTDGIFFARSSDGTRVVILDILEAKSRTNWRALYTGQRAQIRRDIRRLLEEVVSIDGRTYRHANGTLVFLSDHGMRQPWTLSVPRALADAPNILARVRNGAARSQVSGAMASDFTVVHGALPDSEAVRLAEIVLDEVATPP